MVNEPISGDWKYVFRDVTRILRIDDLATVTLTGNVVCEV